MALLNKFGIRCIYLKVFLVFTVDNEMLVNLKIWQEVQAIVPVMLVWHVLGLSLFPGAIQHIDFTSFKLCDKRPSTLKLGLKALTLSLT